MTDNLVFAARHYAMLAVFMSAFWGWGQCILKRGLRTPAVDLWLDFAFAIAVGMGCFILALQGLAVFGQLRRPGINILLVTGIVLALVELRRLVASGTLSRTPLSWPERGGLVLLALYVVPTLMAPLSPPIAGDELMYHLPHAQQWAQTGHLQVNEWLRYPWFPYNFDLLYSAGLVLRGDVFPHLLHALAGWLVALMIYRIGVRYFDRFTAFLATLIWMVLTEDMYATAYIDMGVALFVFAACATCKLWLEDTKYRHWLWVSSFLLGVAAGSKYQALGFLPLFLIVLLWQDRRPGTWLGVVLCFLAPCLYWYARNALLTGDPFNPLGGKIFGFSDWNLADYEYQMYDLRQNASWPQSPLWPALLVPLFAHLRQKTAARTAFVYSVYAFLLWYFTSRYDRYLLPSYPVLALLSASVIQAALFHSPANKLHYLFTINRRYTTGLKLLAFAFLLVLFAKTFVHKLERQWLQIAATPTARVDFLRSHLTAYDLLTQLDQSATGRIYQWGLESVIYYAPHPIWGDHFGPWRYRDRNLVALSPNDLAKKLTQDSFQTLLVRSDFVPGLEAKPDFRRYFQEIAGANGHKAYRILNP